MKVDMTLRKVDKWRVQARVNNSSLNFSINSIELKVILEMVKVNEANEYFQEFNHDSIFKYFQNFGID